MQTLNQDMTAAELADVQAKMDILYKLGFFTEHETDYFPSASHAVCANILGFDVLSLQLTDVIPAIYNLGKYAGKNEQFAWGGWDKWGNHSDTGTRYDKNGFNQNGTHRNGTRYDDYGYQAQGLDRNGGYPEMPF